MTTANLLPESVNLKGTMHRVQVSEGLIVFAEQDGVWGCRQRFSFQRKAGCWYLAIEGTHGDASMGCVAEAYRLVCEAYGGNFEFRNGEHEP